MRGKLAVQEETGSEAGPYPQNHRKTHLTYEPKIPGKVAVTGILHGLRCPVPSLVFATPPSASYWPGI